jgi:hypothetical protein
MRIYNANKGASCNKNSNATCTIAQARTPTANQVRTRARYVAVQVHGKRWYGRITRRKCSHGSNGNHSQSKPLAVIDGARTVIGRRSSPLNAWQRILAAGKHSKLSPRGIPQKPATIRH